MSASHMTIKSPSVCSIPLRRLPALKPTLYIVDIVIILTILILRHFSFVDTFELTHFTDRYSGVAYAMYPVSEQVKEAWYNEINFLQIGPHQSQILGLYFYLLILRVKAAFRA
ncbi:hypothetical protein [Citrobacter meridianamericanus]|uniref:hypothetical protein n=1 Tax=Citrobacter meridianamericanus TaxID=2894201 RepID=UPI0021C69783